MMHQCSLDTAPALGVRSSIVQETMACTDVLYIHLIFDRAEAVTVTLAIIATYREWPDW